MHHQQTDRADERACCEIAVRASMAMDRGDVAEMLSCYTEDLEFVKPSTWPEVSIRGKDDFGRVIATRPANFYSRHLFVNSTADKLNDNEVRVRSYFVHYSGTLAKGDALPLPISSALRSVGEYEDRFVRRAGDWRLQRREGRFVFGGL